MKYVIVLNKKKSIISLCHALVNVAIQLGEPRIAAQGEFVDYTDKDGGSHPHISVHPVIVLSAKNENQLMKPFASRPDDIVYTCYPNEDNPEAVGLFGDDIKLNALTSKFSLFTAAKGEVSIDQIKPHEANHILSIVINSKIEESKLLNAIGHLVIGKVSCLSDTALLDDLAIEIRYSDNNEALQQLRHDAHAQKLACNQFLDTMIEGGSDAQLERTKNTPSRDLQYYAVCLIGDREKVNSLTHQFGMFGIEKYEVLCESSG